MSKEHLMTSPLKAIPIQISSERANALADRLERGAAELLDLATRLTPAEWNTRMSPTDVRTVGVVIHHVANVYPIEIGLAQTVATGVPVTGVLPADIDKMNSEHAKNFAGVAKEEALTLLRRNSAAAAAAIRELSDDELDRAATVSLYSDAPLTCQFVLEDHAVRHSYHSAAKIRKALNP
jgi:hypothetical protein